MMKALNSRFFKLMTVLLAGSACNLQAAEVARIVFEDPDGAMIRNGPNVVVGGELGVGDILETNAATVILTVCDGSLLTVYPNTVLQLVAIDGGEVGLSLVRGEILGDSAAGCSFNVENKVGTAMVSDGVFGVLLNEMGGQGWTLQVRNLDGAVTFVGDPKLDTSNLTVSLIEPSEALEIAPGEEIIVRGIYNESADVFSITQGGVLLAEIEEDIVGEMREDSEEMSSIPLDEDDDADDADDGDVGGDDDVIIEIPYEDIETASDKG